MSKSEIVTIRVPRNLASAFSELLEIEASKVRGNSTSPYASIHVNKSALYLSALELGLPLLVERIRGTANTETHVAQETETHVSQETELQAPQEEKAHVSQETETRVCNEAGKPVHHEVDLSQEVTMGELLDTASEEDELSGIL